MSTENQNNEALERAIQDIEAKLDALENNRQQTERNLELKRAEIQKMTRLIELLDDFGEA